MKFNAEAYISDKWPLEVFKRTRESLLALLDQPVKKVGGKVLILFGDNSDHCELDENFSGPDALKLQFSSVLSEAKSIDVPQWLSNHFVSSWWLPRTPNDVEFFKDAEIAGEDCWWLRPDWEEVMPSKIAEYGEPLVEARNPLTSYLNSELVVNYSIVPVGKAWMIPSYLNCGNWNDVPRAAELSALFRHWEKKYGAEFCLLDRSGDFGFTVERPPETMEEALVLAREHHIFCPYCFAEESNPGVVGMKDLAHFLIGNHGWRFWFE